MKNQKQNVTKKDVEIGLRIKKACKDRGFTREKVAALLEYKNPEQISPIWQGKQKLPNKKLKKLAAALKVRESYLLCESDYETDNELFNSTHADDIKEYRATIDYLSYLGVELTPVLVWRCTPLELYDNYCTMLGCMTDEAIKGINDNWKLPLPKKGKNSNIDDEEQKRNELRLYNPIHFSIELKAVPRECTYMHKLDDLTKYTFDDINKFNGFTGYCCNTVENGALTICIAYKFSYGDIVKYIFPSDMRDFFKLLDSLTQSAIENVLSSSLTNRDTCANYPIYKKI